MKNLLCLFLALTIFSCSSDDNSNTDGQDKFTAWSGKLRVTENNVWIRSFHPENNLKELAAKIKNNPNLTPSASIAFDNKNDAEAFVNDYIDCVINKKTIKKEEYTISYSNGKWEVTNKKG